MKKNLCFFLFLFSVSSFGANDCREVSIQSSPDFKEKVDLCFLTDETYFISRNCKDLSCKFIQKLKKSKLPHSEKNRPGTTACRFLGGEVESVTLNGLKEKISRCIFTDDHSSISLNLLESWNGKKFTGPGPSVDL